MNMPLILEAFIAKYFNKKLMPGIVENYRRLQKKYGRTAVEMPRSGEDFFVASFGYQTSFMMRYMAMAFGAVCVILLVLALTVNPVSFEGLKIFFTFFVLCVILWLITLLQSGYVVYTSDWLYVKRPGKFSEFSMACLEGIKVKGKLTLIFSKEEQTSVEIPLEGSLYMDFVTFCEKHFPHIIAEIPADEYDKAKKKHASAWGNRL